MNDLLAIDFGTSHTKVAYFDNLDSKKPQLMEWERSGQSIPSIFYVEADGETIHIGAEALDRIEKPGFQISGFHENLKRLWKKSEPLKAEILEVDLLTELFKEIREHSVGIPVFKQRHPNGVRLTVTDYLGPKERETLTCAAKKAGFTDVDLIEEPEAAALAWHAANGLDENDFIVVDCGGGTLDLAYLHREKENFRVNATVTGLTKEGNPIGGYEVDEALLELVISKLPEKQKQVSKMPLLRQEVRQLKEAYCKNLQLWPLERGIELKQSAGGVKLTDAEIQSTIDNVYITPALEAISPFIKEVEERSRRGVPPILLVGGSSRLKELDQKLRKRFKCEVLSWERAPYAPVLGAALEKKERFVMSGNQADKQVAEDLRTIAGLIGTAGTNIDVNGEQIETPLEMPTAAKQLTAAAERLEEGLLQVAVIGVTCAGKTTLVDALAGEELLPTSIEVNSGAIVRIVHGDNKDPATLVEGGVPRTVTRKEFRDFIQIPAASMDFILYDEPFPLPDHLNRLDYGILPHDNWFTRSGINLVDTLGFNAGDKAAKVSERFLTEADAIIVVLRSSPPVGEDDVKMIRTQLRGLDPAEKVENMFFVVNASSDLSEADKKKVVENILPRRLGPLFGDDEDLFSRRVFFLNAKKALEARVSGASDEVLAETGVPQFEEALTAVVNSGESRRFLLENTMSKLLLPTLGEVRSHIADNKALLEADLEPLEAAKQAFEAQSTDLNKQVDSVLGTLDAAQKKIADKITKHFEDYFISHLNDWPDVWDAGRESGEFKISTFSLAKAFVSEEKKEELQAELKKPVEKFFEETSSGWQEDLQAHIQPDIVMLSEQLEVEVTELLVDLNTIQASFDVEGDGILNPRESSRKKAFQMVIGAITLDPNQVIGALRDDRWMATVLRFLVDRVAGVVIAGVLTAIFFTGPVALVVMIGVAIAEGLLVYWRDKSVFDSTLKDRIGKVLTETFQNRLPDARQDIQAETANVFKSIRDRLQEGLQAEIEAVGHELDVAIAEHTKGQKNVDRAKARLDKIEGLFNEKFAAISEAVYGHVLTPEEQHQQIEAADAQREND